MIREAWLGGLDQGGLNQRFLAGAVSFCTLMPMRAIPFRLVCLLGMNDGDYPRQQSPLDFDLMRNDYRPGDRSRREDDRYLLLEALLSAREQLYVSWVGRSIRDNGERPPSVLIGQLRDHLAAGWRLDPDGDGEALLRALTQEHPLQPFSRRYFHDAPEQGVDGLFTYAREWREVHREDEIGVPDAEAPLPPLELEGALGLRALAEFLANPVNAFFQQRLKVRFDDEQLTGNDEEPFELDALDNWKLQFELTERMKRLGRAGLGCRGPAGCSCRPRSSDCGDRVACRWRRSASSPRAICCNRCPTCSGATARKSSAGRRRSSSSRSCAIAIRPGWSWRTGSAACVATLPGAWRACNCSAASSMRGAASGGTAWYATGCSTSPCNVSASR